MGEDKNNEYHFLKEETKKVPTNKKRFMKKLGCIIVFAAVFGVVASMLFCLVQHSIDRQQKEPETLPSEVVQEPEQDVPEQIVVQETIEPTLEGYEALQTQLYSIGSKASKSVVAISSMTNDKDWFEDDFQRQGTSSGVILQITASEALILTDTDSVAGANEIEVTFFGDEPATAYLKAHDESMGIAVLAVDLKELEDATKSLIQPIEIAEVAITTPGSYVIGIGSPQEEAYSVVVGNITASGKKVSYDDKNCRMFTTSIASYPNTRGVLLDSDGKIIGIICQNNANEVLRALNITDVKNLLDKLMAGKRPAYLGIRISEVTVDVSQDYGLPDGIFIKEVDMDSPAAEAGIQVGDVIVKIDGQDVITETQFETYLFEAEPEQKMAVTVKRLGSDDQYQEVTCRAELGVAE